MWRWLSRVFVFISLSSFFVYFDLPFPPPVQRAREHARHPHRRQERVNAAKHVAFMPVRVVQCQRLREFT